MPEITLEALAEQGLVLEALAGVAVGKAIAAMQAAVRASGLTEEALQALEAHMRKLESTGWITLAPPTYQALRGQLPAVRERIRIIRAVMALPEPPKGAERDE